MELRKIRKSTFVEVSNFGRILANERELALGRSSECDSRLTKYKVQCLSDVACL